MFDVIVTLLDHLRVFLESLPWWSTRPAETSSTKFRQLFNAATSGLHITSRLMTRCIRASIFSLDWFAVVEYVTKTNNRWLEYVSAEYRSKWLTTDFNNYREYPHQRKVVRTFVKSGRSPSAVGRVRRINGEIIKHHLLVDANAAASFVMWQQMMQQTNGLQVPKQTDMYSDN
jgi:hypothetical protein